jgi:hypothetical protein
MSTEIPTVHFHGVTLAAKPHTFDFAGHCPAQFMGQNESGQSVRSAAASL